HTINAPIVLNADSRIYLGGGDLTLGDDATIAGMQTLYISEGLTASTLTNQGMITPQNVIIEGGLLSNLETISPAGGITINAIDGIASPLIITNSGTMTAGADF